jgi:CO/xanthine dehydrogenase FAD-binding subunit
VSSYSRPRTLDEALELLERPVAVAIGGGTRVLPAPTAAPIEVVDLQALGLNGIEAWPGGDIVIGGTARLRRIVEHEAVPAAVREAARRETSSALRNLATLGGCIVTGDPESELLAALLVHEARVRVARRSGATTVPLPELLADAGRTATAIVEAVVLAGGGVTACARTGRTAADRPIVAAVARRDGHGTIRLALTGVASHPVLVDGRDPAVGLDRLRPPADGRGSSEYRLHLAHVLSRRVLGEVAG